MHQLKIEEDQKVQQHWVLVFFEQKPKYDDQAKQSLQQIQELELIKTKFYKFLKKIMFKYSILLTLCTS